MCLISLVLISRLCRSGTFNSAPFPLVPVCSLAIPVHQPFNNAFLVFVWSPGGGGDQHSEAGAVGQREARCRAEEEAGPEPAQRAEAEPHQELARCPGVQRVRSPPHGPLSGAAEMQSTQRILCSAGVS